MGLERTCDNVINHESHLMTQVLRYEAGHPRRTQHIITQTQVCKIGVWVIFCFRTAQQIINGHFVKLCQLDKGIVADVLELVPLIAA